MCSPVELILLQGRYCISPAKLCLAPFFVQGSSGSGAFLSYIMHTVMYTFFFFFRFWFFYLLDCEQACSSSSDRVYARAAAPDFGARRHFMSIGNWKHAPNMDAAAWACREIWPHMRDALAAAPAPGTAPGPTLELPRTPARALDSQAAPTAASQPVGASGGPRQTGGSSRERADSPAAPASACASGRSAASGRAGGAAAVGAHSDWRGGAAPELHLYGAYESHAARALHDPADRVFVCGHAPTLEVRRLARMPACHVSMPCPPKPSQSMSWACLRHGHGCSAHHAWY